MELKNIIKIVKRYGKFVVLTSLLFGVAAFVISVNLPPTYSASVVIYVRGQVAAPSKDFFTYEGFYSQQTAKEFTDTVAGLAKSQDIIKKALESLGKSSEVKNIKDIQGALSVRKTAPQLVQLTINNADGEEATKAVTALGSAISERVSELNKEGGVLISMQPLDSAPIVEEQKPSVALNILIVALIGLLLSVVVVFIKEYLREEEF